MWVAKVLTSLLIWLVSPEHSFARHCNCTEKPVWNGHSKIDRTKIIINGSLMKVDSIAECSPWSILQYVWLALSDNWSWKPICGLFESGPFYTGFTVSTNNLEHVLTSPINLNSSCWRSTMRTCKPAHGFTGICKQRRDCKDEDEGSKQIVGILPPHPPPPRPHPSSL